MRGTRAAILLLIALAIGLGVAVQHDTFVRRWLLPPPRNGPSPKQLIPHVSTDGVDSIDEAVAVVGRAAGVRIEIDREIFRRRLPVRSSGGVLPITGLRVAPPKVRFSLDNVTI